MYPRFCFMLGVVAVGAMAWALIVSKSTYWGYGCATLIYSLVTYFDIPRRFEEWGRS